MSLIFLIGMPGSGKSSTARMWARSYNWQVLDMDTLMERKHGRIGEIFKEKGSDFFREEEAKLLLEIIAQKPVKTIVATGGGTPCFGENLTRMLQAGCVVYLEASAPELEKRLIFSHTARPLLEGDYQQKIVELLQTREPVYAKAHFIYPSVNITVATFTEIIDACTNRH